MKEVVKIKLTRVKGVLLSEHPMLGKTEKEITTFPIVSVKRNMIETLNTRYEISDFESVEEN